MPTFGPHAVFDHAPHLGFETGESDSEKCYFVFWRDSAKPLDWQGGLDIIADRIPGSGRTLYEHMGAQPLRLETGLMFRDKIAFQQFWRLMINPGLLRMRDGYTVWRADTPDPVRIAGRDYVEFSDVTVAGPPTDVTFDLAGAVYCTVVFEREDLSWS